MEFENIFYPPLEENVFGYRAGCIFVCHEWKNKNKKEEFLIFAENQKILLENEIKNITNDFEINMLKNNTFDYRFEK
jgi:hypothetical protein